MFLTCDNDVVFLILLLVVDLVVQVVVVVHLVVVGHLLVVARRRELDGDDRVRELDPRLDAGLPRGQRDPLQTVGLVHWQRVTEISKVVFNVKKCYKDVGGGLEKNTPRDGLANSNHYGKRSLR